MNPEFDQLRALLCDLQDTIRNALIAARETDAAADFAEVAHVTEADTIYEVDKVSEAAILAWFGAHWPSSQSVQLVMEGIEDDEVVTFPSGTLVEATRWKCILDPIDGTRNIMYDKRSAWSLAALAPQKGAANRLGDLMIAAMTELPTSKQWRADQISGVKGCGQEGLVRQSVNVLNGVKTDIRFQPSSKTDFKHGFASFARFFPEGKALLAALEEELWDELYGLGTSSTPLVFEDQYICTGGQIYELLVGHDRMIGDLRPQAFHKLGLDLSLVCHPYDICVAFLLQEAGGIIEAPNGGPLDAPLNTTSPVSWMGYANPELAGAVRPILTRLMEKFF